MSSVDPKKIKKEEEQEEKDLQEIPEEEEEEEEKEKEKEEKEEEEEEEEKPKHAFKSDEELDAYYNERQDKEKADKATAKIDAKREKGEYFPKNYKPADWNEYTKELMRLIREDRTRFTEKQRKNVVKINQRLNDETEELRALPGVTGIPASGTKARITFDTEVTNIMLRDRSVTSVAKALAVMQDKKGVKGDAKKKKIKLAKKVGGGAGTGEKEKEPKYKKFAERDLDSAAEAALDKFNKLS